MSKNTGKTNTTTTRPKEKTAAYFLIITGIIAFSAFAAGLIPSGRQPIITAAAVAEVNNAPGLLLEGAAASTDRVAVPVFKITAYCPCAKCCGKWTNVYPRRTASGHRIRPGDKFCAADKSIPFGTMIIIPGYNDGLPVPVLDRGGAITGDRLDVYFDSHKEAVQWGTQYLVPNFKI
jgi:3D (Asp-Asp-Asp) domain-containing protein